MTLPPDFWTRPQPGGVAGLGIGFCGRCSSLSFYLLSAARKRFGPGRMSRSAAHRRDGEHKADSRILYDCWRSYFPA